MITVNFIEVGRDKKSWSRQFGILSELAIAKEAKRNGGIMSSQVDAELSDNGSTGTILVGGWRPVGTFTITQP
jgi:hypothetical protein